ncbi:MAG: RNA-directed polymerase, partial [Caballeronia sp.]|nr:RNA-directed polymerase [Caballeronia sp.]
TQYVVRTWRLGNLSTPIRVQKLQMALHAKAKAEAGYRFYALYVRRLLADNARRPRHSVVVALTGGCTFAARRARHVTTTR